MGETLTRLRHPALHGIAPLKIMSGFFMHGSCLVGGIGFIQSEGLRVVPVLQDIKPQISFFLDRVLMILQSFFNKLINIFRFNNNIYNSNDHIVDEKNLAAHKRFADIGRIFAKASGQDDPFYCRQLLDALRKWTQALKLPQLSYFGMTAADMDNVISLSDSKNSPAVLTKKEMKVVLETVR